MATKQEFILVEGRFMRRDIHEYDLGTQEAILAQLADSQSVMLPSFMSFNNQPLHLLVSARSLVICTRLLKLPYKSFFAVDQRRPLTHLAQTFRRVNNMEVIQVDDPWIVPGNFGQTLFCCYYIKNDVNQWLNKSCYLFQYKDRELYKLAYPNIYDDCRICMGPDWEVSARRPVTELVANFISAYNSFHETAMNSDLTNTYTIHTFVRTLDGWDYNIAPENVLIKSAPAMMSGFCL